MKRKIITCGFLFVLSLMLGIGLAAALPALAVDGELQVWVDDDFTDTTPGWGTTHFATIQAGIDAVATSGIINVAAGTYSERILINKPLTLLGATWDLNKNGYAVPGGYAWDDSVESVINNPSGGEYNVVDIYSTNDVTFKGFVVQCLDIPEYQNLANLLRVYADAPGTCDNIIVQNNIIGPNTDLTDQDGMLGRMGLYLATPTYATDGAGITNNTFSGNKIFGCEGNGNNVFVWGAARNYNSPANADYTGTVIEDNEIYGSHRISVNGLGVTLKVAAPPTITPPAVTDKYVTVPETTAPPAPATTTVAEPESDTTQRIFLITGVCIGVIIVILILALFWARRRD